MPVAVRMVEVLALITMLAILTGFSLCVMLVQQIIYLSLYLLGPLATTLSAFLYTSEKMIFGSLMGILNFSLGLTKGGE